MNSTAVHFDMDIMARYSQAGPRYTSYPTAPQFKEVISAQDYVAAATESEDALYRRPLSLYVHIPFCFSPCLYCGCNKIITRHLNRIERYSRSLMREIARRGAYFDSERVIEQLHFGGGTPTYLPKATLMQLMESLGKSFRLSISARRDYSIEIDPRSIDPSSLPFFKALGFNRLSFGVQDFDPSVQRAVNRVQSLEMVRGAYEAARALDFQSINFDLIYGLPLQSRESFNKTLDEVIAMRPDRLAVYGYAHMPQLFKAQRRIRADELPDAHTRMALQQLAIARLSAAGYLYIGLDHFALPSDGLALAKRESTLHRTFQGYTTHASRDLVSFGVSAIGRVGNLYVQNYKNIAKYESAIEEGRLPMERGVKINRDDRLRAEVIQHVMCHGFLDIGEFQRLHGIEFWDYFSTEFKQLESLCEDGLIELSPAHIKLTASGQLLMRAVAMVFDAYLKPSRASDLMSQAVSR